MALQDMVHNLHISANFCIQHPDYQPFELPPEMVARLQKLPPEQQRHYLSLQLRSFLYGIYYNGSMRQALAPESEMVQAAQPNWENNTFLGVDLGFYQQLDKSNSGEGYFDPGWRVLRQEADGTLAVIKNGLTLHIDRDRHLQSEQGAAPGQEVAVRMPHNLVQNGFYMAVGNAGPETAGDPATPPQTVRIYFNFSPDGAIAVMNSLTAALNQHAIPFSFKVLYNPSDYQRHDSGVLYFERDRYVEIRQVLQDLYDQQRSHFQPQVPLFTKALAPGLGLAEEPNLKFAAQESFGMNRCQIVANGLLSAQQQGDESPASRMSAILNQFARLGIPTEQPYLNAGSEDIYPRLDP